MRLMSERRWVNNTQPQTLQIAVILLYLNAVFLLLFGIFQGGLSRYGLILALAQGVGAFGIANERKWGYWLGVAAATALLAFAVYQVRSGGLGSNFLNLVLDVALFALLLHPQSREYRRIWFK